MKAAPWAVILSEICIPTSDTGSAWWLSVIFVRQAKGKKDRVVSLSPVLLVMLGEYALEYKPDKTEKLFEGNTKGTPYSTRSLQEVLQVAKSKAGIIKPGSVHSLRHSFATYLINKGTDVTMIQRLLGHNDLKTTLRYLHTSNKDLLKIISPLDDLKLTQVVFALPGDNRVFLAKQFKNNILQILFPAKM